MRERRSKKFLTLLVNPIAILFFFMNFASAKTSFLGIYPKDRETGWSNECQGVTHDARYCYKVNFILFYVKITRRLKNGNFR